jgi:hypothetical protein
LILLHILPTRNSNLDQDYLSHPFWVITKEDLESVQFLRHTLDIIQPVNTHHKLDALEFLL